MERESREISNVKRTPSMVSDRVLINRKQLLKIVPMCARTIDEYEKKGQFPRRIMLSSRYAAWDLSEVQAWMDAIKDARAPQGTGMGA